MENISIPDPILWYEGMPLLPHHFQQESIRFQSLFQMYLQVLGKFNYGILEMDIDRVLLAKNTFKINKIFAVMPDGLIIKTDSYKDNQNLEYVLPNPNSANKNGLSIYLTLPKLIANNYIMGKFPRYKKEELSDVLDLNTGLDPIEVPKMAPNLQVNSELDLDDNFVKLKLAQLKVEKNIWDFDKYTPATTAVSQETDIYKICADLCYALRKKINYVAELIYAKGHDKQASFISEHFFYAQGLGANLPYVEGLLYSNGAHPFQLYTGLCQILGGMSLLTKDFTPPFPTTYEHEELFKTFTTMRDEIYEIINSVVDEKMARMDFTKENDIYYATIAGKNIEKNVIYIGLRKQSSSVEYDFLNWMNHAIICDASEVELSIHNRILGFHREKVERTEDILPTRGTYLYKITLQDDTRVPLNLAILNPDDRENAPQDMFLFLPAKKGAKI